MLNPEEGTRFFFLMSAIATLQLEVRISATPYPQRFQEMSFCNCIAADMQSQFFPAVRNFVKKCCYTAAYSQKTVCNPQLFKGLFIRSCVFALLQSKQKCGLKKLQNFASTAPKRRTSYLRIEPEPSGSCWLKMVRFRFDNTVCNL
jgi:hypothetical protein